MPRDIEERTFSFALAVIRLCQAIRAGHGERAIIEQAMRAAASVGANVEEAHAGYTQSEFSYRVNIALREAREAQYWLRLLRGADLVAPGDVDCLIGEAEELKKILGSIASKLRDVQRH